jgi:hypothetical protein
MGAAFFGDDFLEAVFLAGRRAAFLTPERDFRGVARLFFFADFFFEDFRGPFLGFRVARLAAFFAFFFFFFFAIPAPSCRTLSLGAPIIQLCLWRIEARRAWLWRRVRPA